MLAAPAQDCPLGHETPEGDDGQVVVRHGCAAAPLPSNADRATPTSGELSRPGSDEQCPGGDHVGWRGRGQPPSRSGPASVPTRPDSGGFCSSTRVPEALRCRSVQPRCLGGCRTPGQNRFLCPSGQWPVCSSGQPPPPYYSRLLSTGLVLTAGPGFSANPGQINDEQQRLLRSHQRSRPDFILALGQTLRQDLCLKHFVPAK